MNNKVIVCGSIAYDDIMFFDGKFSDSLMKENLDNLSVSFLAGDRNKYFGGCSMNIAYSLKLLGMTPTVVGAAGNDFDEYAKWFKENGISTDYIAIDDDRPCACAFILNDNAQSQIAVFSPSAMGNKNLAMNFDGVDLDGASYAIIGPDLPDRMVSLSKACLKADVKYIFDPGQAMPALSDEQLENLVADAFGLILNDYESELLSKRLGKSLDDLSHGLSFLLKTLGENGVQVFSAEGSYTVPAITGLNVVEVTGCGDAFRSGFIAGLLSNSGLKRACEMGCVSASYVLEMMGTQKHHFTRDEFDARLIKHYGA